MKTEMMKHDSLPVVATLPVCNGLSLNIYGAEYGIDDKVITGYTGETPRKNKLYYTSSGKTYFRKHGQRFYLYEFMVVNG